jgi:uncharacterized phage protein gp47/JayE
MPIQIRSRQEINDTIKVDVKNKLPNSNPFLKVGFLPGIIAGLAGISYSIYVFLTKTLLNEFFIDTASATSLTRIGAILGLELNPATQAQGLVNVEGVESTLIPKDSVLQSQTNETYKTLQDATIISNTIIASGITQSSGIATVVFSTPHNLSSNMTVTISGANEPDYNGTFSIIVISAEEFTYNINPAAPGVASTSGTFDVLYTKAQLEILSEGFGQSTNLENGAEVSFIVPIPSVNTSGYVQIDGVAGGTDIETTEEYRARLKFKVQNPIAGGGFNETAIKLKAKEISGVTKVWVFSATPANGQATIYFVRYNDFSPIPSASEVEKVKNKLLEIKVVPMGDSDVIVSAPTPVIQNFTFSNITPDTQSMRDAIQIELSNFFKDQVNVSESIPELLYSSVLINTIDDTGSRLQSFTLSDPTGDISIASGELALLGDVTYP